MPCFNPACWAAPLRPRLTRLRELDLSGNPLGGEGLGARGAGPGGGGTLRASVLRYLHESGGQRALGESEGTVPAGWMRLRTARAVWYGLYGTGCTLEGVDALASGSAAWPKAYPFLASVAGATGIRVSAVSSEDSP